MQAVQVKTSSLAEQPLGIEVRVFGNVAVAVAGCEITENENEKNALRRGHAAGQE
jgi:hypothetical protein